MKATEEKQPRAVWVEMATVAGTHGYPGEEPH